MGARAAVAVAVAVVSGIAAAVGCGSGSPATNSGSASSGGATSSGSGSGAGGGPFMQAAHPPFPVLPPGDMVELQPPRLVIVVGPGDPDASQFFAFGDALLQRAWLGTVGKDYGIAAKPGATSMHLTGGPVPATMDTTALRAYLEAVIAANPAAAPDGHTLYLFFYPPGTGHGDACADLGAHNFLTVAPYAGKPVDSLAWVQRCTNPPGMSDLDAMTITASHEVMEAATDSYPPHGWAMPYKEWALAGKETPWAISSWSYLQGNAVEVGDLCEATSVHEGAFAYQRIWSTTAAKQGGDPCVPPSPEPYYSASAPSDWIAATAGTVAMVPVTGWATAARADWSLIVRPADFWDEGFSAAFSDGTQQTMLNNGVTAMLSVTMPPASGAFAVFMLESSDSPPDPVSGFIPQPAMGDRKHVWVFGAYTTAAGPPLSSCGNGACDANESCATCPTDCGPCGAACGVANFGVPCGPTSCPTYASCQPDGSCACGAGYESLSCDGTPCSGASCVSPSWWCVPSTCGMAGFITPCGGGNDCPGGSACLPGNQCACAPGTIAGTCEGQPCPKGGCSFPDWGCMACGSPQGQIMCSGYTCPAFSTCGANNDCTCMAGYRAVTCDGQSCDDGAKCLGANWWCYPE